MTSVEDFVLRLKEIKGEASRNKKKELFDTACGEIEHFKELAHYSLPKVSKVIINNIISNNNIAVSNLKIKTTDHLLVYLNAVKDETVMKKKKELLKSVLFGLNSSVSTIIKNILCRDYKLGVSAEKKIGSDQVALCNDKIHDLFKEGDEVYIEDKCDGIRVLVEFDGSSYSFTSRNGKEIKFFGEFAPAPATSRYNNQTINKYILDCEFVVHDTEGVQQFSLAQSRKIDGYSKFVVFDILNYNGDDLRCFKLQDRKNYLHELVLDERYFIKLASQKVIYNYNKLVQCFANLNRPIEGLVIKKANQEYLPGKRIWGRLKIYEEKQFYTPSCTKSSSAKTWGIVTSINLHDPETCEFVSKCSVKKNEDRIYFGKLVDDNGQFMRPISVYVKYYTGCFSGKSLRSPVLMRIISQEEYSPSLVESTLPQLTEDCQQVENVAQCQERNTDDEEDDEGYLKYY